MPLTAFTNTFAGNPLERASYRRSDPAWITARLNDPEALAIVMWNGRPLVESPNGEGARIAYLGAAMARELAGGMERLLFLGLWQETAVFALDLDGEADPAGGVLEGLGRFEELRAVAQTLQPTEAAILATAKAVFEWRRRHRHCSACGTPSEVAEGGWKRICPACKAEHFPRTDPVVIMLPVKGERCLVGRQAAWPKLMFSALAGFVEPGESLEEACAREVWEEAHLKVTTVRYHSTQPWPWPASLMIGLIAEVETYDAAADDVELDEVKWLTRAEAREMIAGRFADAKAPGPLAIAHQIIKAWADEGA